MFVWTLLVACAPPPLDASMLPSIEFVFPESRNDIVICPDFVVTVDIDNWDVQPYRDDQTAEEELRRGHWHLRDELGEYISISVETWVEVNLEGDFETPELTVFTAHISNHDHNELNPLLYPNSVATAEFLVGNTADCVGAPRGGEDTQNGG